MHHEVPLSPWLQPLRVQMKLAKTVNILQNIKKKLELKRAKAHIGLTRGAIEWWAHIQQATFEQLGSSLALVAENLKQIQG